MLDYFFVLLLKMFPKLSQFKHIYFRKELIFLRPIQWTTEDFNVFTIDGLEERMEALTTHVRPKFHALGDDFSAFFSTELGEEFFPHVAKHARRTVNPPKDSWVAFAPYKRGYKALPHFQIGLWNSHLFIMVAVIYEAPNKAIMAERLLENVKQITSLPTHYVLSGDHMSPAATTLQDADEEGTIALLKRLRDVKKAEFLVGVHVPVEEAVKLSGEAFTALVEETFTNLLPIYKTLTAR